MEIWKKMWVGVFFLNTVYIRELEYRHTAGGATGYTGTVLLQYHVNVLTALKCPYGKWQVTVCMIAVACSLKAAPCIEVFTFQRLHRRPQIVNIVKEQTIVGCRRSEEAQLSTSCRMSSYRQLLLRVRLLEQLIISRVHNTTLKDDRQRSCTF